MRYGIRYDPLTRFSISSNGGYKTPCWLWGGRFDRNDYGTVYDSKSGKQTYAHLLFYEKHIGVVSFELELDHLCENRWCVNPSHLEPVTHAVNVQRSRSAKFTMELANEVRNLHLKGSTILHLAAVYKVSESTIWKIVGNRTWIEVVQ